MGKASLTQEKRDMVFEEVFGVWTERRLTQEDAAERPSRVQKRRRAVRPTVLGCCRTYSTRVAKGTPSCCSSLVSSCP